MFKLRKFHLVLMLTLIVSACAGMPGIPAGSQPDDHIVKGGALAAEGKVYIPLPLPGSKNPGK